MAANRHDKANKHKTQQKAAQYEITV